MTGKDDERSLADLCRPLSAKVMPRSAMYNIGGREMNEGRALSSQRSSVAALKRKRKKGEKPKP